MPGVQAALAEPVAVLVSDVHLSHKAPACRAEQTTEEWYGVMRRYLTQLYSVCRTHYDGPYDKNKMLPILLAGDLFDRWDSPPELINFAIEHWPKTKTYAVAGQHDLPNHSLEYIHRSAYWTMVGAGTICNFNMGYLTRIHPKVYAVGFPWGCGLDPGGVLRTGWGAQDPDEKIVAVAHTPVWSGNRPFPDATDDSFVTAVMKRFQGFDVVHTGDYHKTEIVHRQPGWHPPMPTVFNPGTFLIRKSDEIGHAPKVGVLHADGTVKTQFLDVSADRFVSAPKEAESQAAGLDAGELLKELRSAADRGIDFVQTVARIMASKDFGRMVQGFIDKCLEDK
jgi:hypothetical protein